MADIIKFRAADAPDAAFVRRDEYGRPVYCYLAEYDHDGANYCLEFWAYNEAEAMARIVSMVAHLSYAGQKMAEVQA